MSERKKTALVTGASSGMGRETAIRLADAGFGVIAAARRMDRLQELAADRPGIVPRRVDLADADQVDGLCAEILDRDAPIDVLINNAGYAIRGVVEAVPVADVRRMFEVNVFSPMRITQACLPGMRAARSGTIINLSSLVGKFAFPGSGPYAASKHAVEAFTDALRHEAAPFGIRVVVIRPGPVATEFNEAAGEYTRRAAENTPREYEYVSQRIGAGFANIFGTLEIPGPHVAADVIMEAALSDNPKAAYEVGPLVEEYLGERKGLDDDEWRRFMDSRMALTDFSL